MTWKEQTSTSLSAICSMPWDTSNSSSVPSALRTALGQLSTRRRILGSWSLARSYSVRFPFKISRTKRATGSVAVKVYHSYSATYSLGGPLFCSCSFGRCFAPYFSRLRGGLILALWLSGSGSLPQSYSPRTFRMTKWRSSDGACGWWRFIHCHSLRTCICCIRIEPLMTLAQSFLTC